MVTIYAIRCAINGKVYVGCTRGKMNKRMREHRRLLNSGKHSEKGFLADWQKYGPSMFHIEMIDSFMWDHRVSTMREAEKRAMDYYAGLGLLYNTNRNCFQGTPESMKKASDASRVAVGNRWSPEANEKRRLAQLGKPKGHGAKISATKRAKQMMR